MDQTTVKKQSWWQLLSIQAGGATCLPVIMVGQLVCQKFGWLAALLGVGLGNAFLLVIGYLLASLSTYRPQSTVQHTIHYFGNQGRFLFASLMLFSMLGWFGIQLNVMSLSSEQLLNRLEVSPPPLFLNIGIGILLGSVMCLGMKAMKWLSYFSAPLLGITLLYALFSTRGPVPTADPLTTSWLGGLSLVIGANIAAVIDLPTFFRHAQSGKDARICIFLLYGLVVPFIEVVGIYLCAITGGNSILEVLQAGHGTLWAMWISCFVLLSGWATNNANLYSAMTSSYSLPGQFTPTMRTLTLAAIGIVIACFNPLGNIEDVLDLLGVTIGSMGAVVLASYLLERSNLKYINTPWISILSWSIGITIGMSSSFFHWFTTGVPTFDAFLVSLLTQLILNTVYQRTESYEAIDN